MDTPSLDPERGSFKYVHTQASCACSGFQQHVHILTLSFYQDGAYSYGEFIRTFAEYDVQRVMRAYENSITISLHCCKEGSWTQDRINGEQFSEFCQVGHLSVHQTRQSLFEQLFLLSGQAQSGVLFFWRPHSGSLHLPLLSVPLLDPAVHHAGVATIRRGRQHQVLAPDPLRLPWWPG